MNQSNQTLPPGEADPNLLYVAVGRAIHAWESMEMALARLYARFTDLPENPIALADYGAENKIFTNRIDALKSAGDAFFVKFPDQNRESQLFNILKDAKDLSIKRHRVAHGYITMWTEVQIPKDSKGAFVLEGNISYRWGAPFYSMSSLRTDPVGGDAASIEKVQKEFEALHNRIFQFCSSLPTRSSGQ